MKATFKTKDPTEAKRLAYADDIAFALWQILTNLPKRTAYMMETATDPFDAHEKIWEAIREEVDFDIDELIN